MPSIPREVVEHSLEIRAGSKAVKQWLRRFDEEKRKIISEDIHKLLTARFIKEVHHPDWLANRVLVKKKNGKMRMCVDYTSLNKACPKVPFPLPRIDQIVDSTAGCETLSFLDAYSGYHQIKMKGSDQLATSFITPFGMYCYVTMLFGLRNAGVTYQRCMLHVFGKHIGSTVEAYVDDIIVKSKKQGDLIQDLEIAFSCLRANKIKLNPEKCVFTVPRGMLLGYMVSQHGIEANPEKVLAITRMGPIRDVKGVQKVTGCLAALSCFISRLGEKALPLYRLLKKAKRFSWTPKAKEALDNLKKTLTSAPVLVPTSACRTSASIRRLDDPGGQCGRGGRKEGRRTCAVSLEAGLLHQQGTLKNQGMVSIDPETNLRGDPHPTQAATLLPRPPYHGSLILPPG